MKARSPVHCVRLVRVARRGTAADFRCGLAQFRGLWCCENLRIAGNGLPVPGDAPCHCHEARAEAVAPGTDPVTMEGGVVTALVARRAHRVTDGGREEASLRSVDEIDLGELLVEEGATAQLRYCMHIQYRSALQDKRQAFRMAA